MKKILSTAGIVLVLFLGFQTHESASANQISVTCEADEAESSGCVSLGPLGSLNPSGIQLWIRMFIRHGLELPKALETALRNALNELGVPSQRWLG